jgi:hypothetical protein
MKYAVFWDVTCYFPPKSRFLQEPHGVTSQKMAFFIAVPRRYCPSKNETCTEQNKEHVCRVCCVIPRNTIDIATRSLNLNLIYVAAQTSVSTSC